MPDGNSDRATPRETTIVNRAALAVYSRKIECTDKLPVCEIQPASFGLFGEVGSLLAVVKKHERDGPKIREWNRLFIEELADVLWYFATLSRRLGADFDQLFVCEPSIEMCDPTLGDGGEVGPKNRRLGDSIANIELAEAAAQLLAVKELDQTGWEALQTFGSCYIQVVAASGLTLDEIIQVGMSKAHHGFVLPPESELPQYDIDFPPNERLPEHFEIKFMQRADGKCELLWNRTPVGDPLNDAIVCPDGFRFHDVFHLAHVAVLHWSPTFRSLMDRKRKSAPTIDDTEDSARARIVEEGIVAWLFGIAKESNFFEDHELVAFDLLKTIAQFVRGFEVERCPLRLWEKAILTGYHVFRQVRANEGGVVIGDRRKRTLVYAGRG